MTGLTVPPPKAPLRLDDTGLAATFLRDLLLKTVFRTNLQTTSAMAKACALSPTIIEDLLTICRADNLMETLGNRNADGASELRYQLTDSGRARALDALWQSEYYGPAPVPVLQFEEQSKAQSIKRTTISKTALKEASSHLVLSPDLLDQLGPSVNSGRSILLYGPPGNGKSVLSHAIRAAIPDDVFIPHALEYSGQVIALYDPIIHRRTEGTPPDPSALRRDAPHDPRYVQCRRPSVITGGELTVDMLDLGYNPSSKVYQAPLQLKATGGIFIVDDLGRQREPAQALMNRWIVPIEERYDLLALQSGQKFTVPFDTLVIFSTNFAPKNLFDGAALRRIYYKIRIDGPSRDDFLQIFLRVARAYKMRIDERVLAHVLTVLYPREGAKFAAFHAPFLIDQMAAICTYEGREVAMTIELVERAWSNLFVADEENTL